MFNSAKMVLAVVITVVMMLTLCSAQAIEFHVPGLPERCLPGSLHKDSPTVENECEGGFDVCAAWQGKEACCTRETRAIISGRTGRYNWSSGECAPLSEKCEQYVQVSLHYLDTSPPASAIFLLVKVIVFAAFVQLGGHLINGRIKCAPLH